jgi:transposase-like protein
MQEIDGQAARAFHDMTHTFSVWMRAYDKWKPATEATRTKLQAAAASMRQDLQNNLSALQLAEARLSTVTEVHVAHAGNADEFRNWIDNRPRFAPISTNLTAELTRYQAIADAALHTVMDAKKDVLACRERASTVQRQLEEIDSMDACLDKDAKKREAFATSITAARPAHAEIGQFLPASGGTGLEEL